MLSSSGDVGVLIAEPPCSQDKYVSIYGSIKVFGGKRQVSATHVRLITNHNEVFNHLLKAVYVSMSLRNPGGMAVSLPGPPTIQSRNSSLQSEAALTLFRMVVEEAQAMPMTILRARRTEWTIPHGPLFPLFSER